MGVFDLFKKFKKKKKIEKPEEVKKPLKVKIKKKPKRIKRPPEKGEEIKPEVLKPKTKISGLAYRILKTPHITEKATGLVNKNQYVFKVWPRANKIEIKKAIEDVYGVDVDDVKVINIPKKQRRLGRQTGWRKGYKKAIVKIKEGQKIEVLPR